MNTRRMTTRSTDHAADDHGEHDGAKVYTDNHHLATHELGVFGQAEALIAGELPGARVRRHPPERGRLAHAHHALPAAGGDREIGPDPAFRLVAGCDGRPDAGQRAHPRGDDGDGRAST